MTTESRITEPLSSVEGDEVQELGQAHQSEGPKIQNKKTQTVTWETQMAADRG